jgi:hypothetical protein
MINNDDPQGTDKEIWLFPPPVSVVNESVKGNDLCRLLTESRRQSLRWYPSGITREKDAPKVEAYAANYTVTKIAIVLLRDG